MIIDNKFETGEIAWILYDNKIRTVKIIAIHVIIRDVENLKSIVKSLQMNKNLITYDFIYQDKVVTNVYEPHLFKTKEELLKSL